MTEDLLFMIKQINFCLQIATWYKANQTAARLFPFYHQHYYH